MNVVDVVVVISVVLVVININVDLVKNLADI